MNEFVNALSVSPKDIVQEVPKLISDVYDSTRREGLFVLKRANDWIEEAKSRPIPQMLFGEFWFEGELCILFADTNLGKSILGVQIADSLSRGEGILGLRLDVLKQPVLLADFELSEKQFENRYSKNFTSHYVFDPYFYRIELNPDAELPKGENFEDYLHDSLEKLIKETGAKILIIDNITYLKNETEKAKDALPLMKQLKALKKKYGLSILVLAHTPVSSPIFDCI